MSVNSTTQTEFVMPRCDSKALDEALGSLYALQVANQTLKERCQQLQAKLASIEEENHHLKTKGTVKPLHFKIENESYSVKQYEQLQRKINQLTHEKAHLLQKTSLVSSENTKLWSRLSRLTQANQSLGSHLIKISDTLNQHDSNVGIKHETQMLSAEGDVSVNKETGVVLKSSNANLGIKDQSLEEISLKLINSFLQEKEELEQQYAQMVEIHREASINIQDVRIPYFEEQDEVEDKAAADLVHHLEKLQEMRDILTEQQQALRDGIVHLSKIKNGNVEMCTRCQEGRNQSGKLQVESSVDEDLKHVYTSVRFGECLNEDIQQQLSGVVEPPQVTKQSITSIDTASLEMDSEDLDVNSPNKEDRICPMCGKFYPKRIPFEAFQKHVLLHFTDEPDPVLDNFEIIS